MRYRDLGSYAALSAVLLASGSLLLAGDVAPAATPPTLRLGDAARPVRYAAELTVVPSAQTFTGAIDIDMILKAQTSLLWLNGSSLKLKEAKLTAHGETIAARVVPGGDDFIGFAFERAAPAGPARLHVTYEGELSRRETSGLFRQQEGGEWYAFSQFESTDARRAFPCFDEPSYKVPWQLTLVVKKEHVAVSNTPILSVEERPEGMKAVTFAETRPLPSYLVALGVGPFDVVDAGRAGRKSTPLRVIAPKGRGDQARYAAEAIPRLLTQLEDYFDIPYPYEKLDSLAVPFTAGFWAMENAGLITYNAAGLLAKPEDTTSAFKRGFAETAAHEMGHQWFGDLVTMAWWDDTWLNESFASWVEGRIIGGFEPEWDAAVERVRSRSGIMNADALVAARRIRQPIQTRDDIVNAFDGITYQKGQAVLAMFERWLGEDAFRRGVRRYLASHQWGNATSADFLSALAAEGGPQVAPAFSTFLDQPGVPFVTVERRCEAGAPPKLLLSQKRLLPQGSRGSSDETWHVPVCVRYRVGGKESRSCTLLAEKQGTFVLDRAGGCPDWLLANDGETGYYRVLYQGDLLRRLLDGDKELALAERVGVFMDVAALARTGDLRMGEVLDMAASFAHDPSPYVVEATAGTVEGLYDHLVPPEMRPNLARFIQATYGEGARTLGFTPRPGEADAQRELRRTLLAVVGGPGADKALRTEARRRVLAWLDDRKAIDSDVLTVTLVLAAEDGDRTLFDRLRAEIKRSQDRRERGRLFDALGAFRSPEIVPVALALVLSDEFEPIESVRILRESLGDPATREAAYAFLKEHFDAIVARLPRESRVGLAAVGGAFCDAQHRSDLEAFLRARIEGVPGGPRILAQALERMDLCIAFKRAQEPSVVEFLGRYASVSPAAQGQP
jgi:alanyl aminopeptidase